MRPRNANREYEHRIGRKGSLPLPPSILATALNENLPLALTLARAQPAPELFAAVPRAVTMPRAATAIRLLFAAAFVGANATSNATASACPSRGCGINGACRNGACLCSAGWHGINDWVDTGGCNVHRYTQHVLHVIGGVFCVVTLLHACFSALKERRRPWSTCASGADTQRNAAALPSSAAWSSGVESAVRAASTTLPSSAAWSDTETVRAPRSGAAGKNRPENKSEVESHVAQQPGFDEPTASSGGRLNLGHVLGDRPPPPNSEETCNTAAGPSPRKRRARINRLIVHAHIIMTCIFGFVLLLFYEGRLPMSLSTKCGGPTTISKNRNTTAGADSLHSNLYRPCAIAFVPLPMSIIHSIMIAGTMSISGALIPSMWLNLLPCILMNRAPFLRSLQIRWATVAIPLTFGLDAVYLFLGLMPAFDTAESERLAIISVKATLVVTGLLAVPAATIVTIVAVKVFAMLALREQPSAWVVQLWKLIMSGRIRLDGGVRDRIVRKLRLSTIVLNVVAGGATVGCFLLISQTWFEYNPHIGESFLLTCAAAVVLNVFLVLFRPRRRRRLARRTNLDSTNGSVRSSVAKSSVAPHP